MYRRQQMKCKCGKELLTSDQNGMCTECRANAENLEHYKTGDSYTGWICPKCGYVWAIWVDGCSNCNMPQMTVEITDGSGTDHADKTKP